MFTRAILIGVLGFWTTAIVAEDESLERLFYEGPNKWMAEAVDQANSLHDALDAGEDVPFERYCEILEAISFAAAMGLEKSSTYMSRRYGAERYAEIVLPATDRVAMTMAMGYTMGPAMRHFEIDTFTGVLNACDAR